MSSKIKKYVPKTFTDAGTGEVFEGGKEHLFDAGASANYEAAGLFGEAPSKAEVAAKAEAASNSAPAKA